jgi:prefoldin subunit 5
MAREREVLWRGQEIGRHEESLSMLEDRLNREREALKTQENMTRENFEALAQHGDTLNQREATLQETTDLVQRWLALEHVTEQMHAQNYEVLHKDFHAKTDAALERFKKHREDLDCEKRDLEAELKKVMESRRDIERVLEEVATGRYGALSNLDHVEQENQTLIQQIAPLTQALQDARDAQAEEHTMKRQRA